MQRGKNEKAEFVEVARRDGRVCSAIERTHAAGLECHCNVFLTKDNTCQFSEILDTLKSMGVERTSFSLADYQPTRRGRRHEQIRPELGDLSPMADRAFGIDCSAKAIEKAQWIAEEIASSSDLQNWRKSAME